MSPRVRSFLLNAATLLITLAAITIIVKTRLAVPVPPETAASVAPIIAATSSPVLVPIVNASSTPATLVISSSTSTPKKAVVVSAVVRPKPSSVAASATSSGAVEVVRIQDPYATPQESIDELNTQARAALVNIFCTAPDDSIQSISGSGVIIDTRGIILTNAHVAQYVLLSESPQFQLSCVVRAGSPASDAWKANVIFIPPVWVSEHAQDINNPHPTGTGEHDYAFLRITDSANGAPLPASFPAVPIDAREGIGFLSDQILGASYPAELVGPEVAQSDLYAVTSVSTVQQLLTFGTSTIDVLSLGGVIEAQGGSSGGPVLNTWGYLIGLITTTSEGTTTAQRDLRAITLSYIDRDMEAQTGQDIQSFLAQDPAVQETTFDTNTAPALINQYVQVLEKQQ